MQIASRNGNLDILRILHRSGGSIYSRGPRGDTLFHLATSFGNMEVMKWLIRQGLFPGLLDMFGQSAVHVAARRAELEILKYLHFELHLDFAQEDFDGKVPLDCVPKRASGLENVDECRKFIAYVMEDNDSD